MKTAEEFLKEQEIHQVYIGGIVYEVVKLSQAIKASEKFAAQQVKNNHETTNTSR